MIRKLVFLLFVAIMSFAAHAQTDSASSHLRISLLTCGPGDEEIYEVFGHTAVRVIDSNRHADIVYNYGTFEYGPNFEMQFMRGKLLYCLAIEPFNGFMQEYVDAHRSVQEQVLLFNKEQAQKVSDFLQNNALPENKYYKYDFFFDNCATRIRDIFSKPEVFGTGFKFGQTIPTDSKITFRNIINRYFYRDHWTRFGINILLGSKIDPVMSNTDIMFLPDYLRDGVGGASVNGQKIATDPVIILPGNGNAPATINTALLFTCFLALLTIAGLCIPKLHILGRIMSITLLVITGLLGTLILVMWFGTDHQGCSNNYNLLWALPTNLIAAMMVKRSRSMYSIIAIILIMVSLLLHVLKVQELPMPEIAPLLLALLFIFGTIYKRDKKKQLAANA